ncbi:MAG TPA: MBL fold metallo-hydrolase [Syntrophales bacterium]|jgi:glyoxylase-like metal-dependent hydrolase (beta-lactamase superfamily II)|nr:MBL fold metallo-hydrolase [Syntrophales bacterium]
MGRAEAIWDGIWLVGGPDVSRSDDATVFVVDFQGELVMIDSGAGGSSKALLRNIEGAGLDPGAISTLILTHCHIDHIGSAPFFRDRYGCRILIHELDAEAIEAGDPVRTAANWYETDFPPTRVDRRLKGEEEVLAFGGEDLHCLHTPGHTPGSIVVWLDRNGKRVLFGQDIHGPFMSAFRSNISDWRASMKKILALEPDVLCEGHFGIFEPKEQAAAYIHRYLRMNG